ncbi:hypothetical protein EFP17_14435 [Burkholderia glumae]|nr:hypothetical protein EFP17_14435 [Burkholderia glumae]
MTGCGGTTSTRSNRNGNGTGKLVAPNGRRMAVPVSPSDRRGFENHVHQVERLQALPAGPIRKRKGKCH